MSLGWTVAGFSVLYVGVTPTLALTTDLIVGAAPRNRSGMASSVAESGAELGLAAGIAGIGVVASAVYRSRLFAGAPSGVTKHQLDEAGETVGNAVALADELPGGLGTALLDAVRGAFADGLVVATWASTVLLLIGALLALSLLRRPGT